MLSINDDVTDISHVRLVICMILHPLELIFPVVSFNGFSCLEESLCNYSYQSLDSSRIVDEYSKILHHHCIRIRKEKMDKVNFSLFFWVSFLTFCIASVVHQSKISLYPGWKHLNNCSLLGLYWALVQLWSWDLPNFQKRVPNAMEISHWEVDPEVFSSCVSFSSVQVEAEIIEIYQCWNEIFSVIELSVIKMGLNLQQTS